MKKNILTLLLISIFIIFLILNIKIYLEIKSKKEYLTQQLQFEQANKEQIDKYYSETGLEEVRNTNTYYKLKFCVEKYFTSIFNMWQNEENINKQYYNEVLDILAKDYKNEKNLTYVNIKDLFIYSNQERTVITKAYQYNVKEGIVLYILGGYNICNDGTNKEAFQIMLVIDTNQNTFEIYPEDYLKEYGSDELKLAKMVNELKNKQQVEKNDNNKINIPIISNEKIAQDYFELYIFNIKYNVEEAYNMLNDEYKKKRFPTIQDFKEYFESREELYSVEELKDYTEFDNTEEYILYIMENEGINLSGFNVKYEDDEIRYICLDNYNNYYIFNMRTPLDYTVTLDTYTIDLPEFIEKYEKATTEEKVGYNIEKIVNALNMQDYNYIYSKLAEEFKTKYFKTYEEFEEYAKDTFDIGNEVTYNRYTESQNLSSYQITLEGKYITVTKTIVMRLEEGTDFVFSFNVE